MGDATSAPARNSQPPAAQAALYKTIQKVDSPPPLYTGEDRRKNSRRKSALTTTLDTRKSGIDRRKTGRISLKV